MKWSDQHDLELVKEILAERALDHPKGSRQIGQVRQTFVDNLNSRADIVFNLKTSRRFAINIIYWKKVQEERKRGN